MADSVVAHAPAKINVGLSVFPRRADGYHDIEGIFTTVSLHDSLSLGFFDGEGECLVDCPSMELPKENTFTAAYKAFCVLTGIKSSVRVTVDKRIPSGGGLGGGSSDAASFIQSVDRLFNTRLLPSQLYALALSVGSDVPFFMHALLEAGEGKPYAAYVSGRGELVERLPARGDFEVSLALPGIQVSTREAYCWLDEAADRGELGHNSFSGRDAWKAEWEKDIREWSFVNDFTVPVARRHGKISRVIDEMKESGAAFADMSGSGSTVFGVFAC
ncbi:MAG: 4-(cytidine 5'-diphospho)-2-C-methyl-D-erythritol kinase [Treponema sp.]|nr:4-(cytidine 5'-diphospho)-2-C-methyl-D-erythritol kinase [Treponema sp.]